MPRGILDFDRLLWASTGTKNTNYRDVICVEELIPHRQRAAAAKPRKR
jgi:hypothetical protein